MGREVLLQPVSNRLAIRFKEPAPMQVRSAAADELALGPADTQFQVPGEKLTIYQVPGTRHLDDLTAAGQIFAAAADRSDIDRVTPVFALGPTRAVLSDRLMVGIEGSRPEAGIRTLGLEIIERFPGGLLVRLPPYVDPESLLERVSGLPGVTFAEPDLVVIDRYPRLQEAIGPSGAARPTFGIGYAADRTMLPAAYQLARSTASTVIAILDDGIDVSHPDLHSALSGTYDATTDSPSIPADAWNEHGTACAGLAAGAGDVRGFGTGCSLLAVRIAMAAAPGAPWVSAMSNVRRGIDWAASRAAVLSLSWGGTALSSAVADALARARTNGRGGRGCVIVAAAGNRPGPVDFPASLPDVIAVSGTNATDEFKTPSSSDGETWWGSASGSQIDIAAPSVAIRTTGLTGPAGETPDDYLPAFNGTSAATPMIAGAAALLLSAAPSSTEQQIRVLLTATADKVGPLPYISGRNDQYGAGRLNVFRAVQALLGTANPSPDRSDPTVPAGEVHLPLSSQAGGNPRGDAGMPATTGASDGTASVPPNEVRLPLPSAGSSGGGQSPHGDEVPAGEVHLPLSSSGSRA